MEPKIITLALPCQEEIIGQMVGVQQLVFSCSSPFLSLVNNLNPMIGFNLEQASNDQNTVFVIAQTVSSIIGFAQGKKIHANHAPGFLRGIGAREWCGDEYFYLDTVAVSPWYQKQGVGKKLIEQILGTQTCQYAFLWTQRDSAMFRLILNMGGEKGNHTSPNGCYMRIPIKTI